MKRFLFTSFFAFYILSNSSWAQNSTALKQPKQSPALISYNPKTGARLQAHPRSRILDGANQYRRFSIGFQAGVLTPVILFGGLNQFPDYKYNRARAGFLKFQLSHSFALRTDYLNGNITATNTTGITKARTHLTSAESFRIEYDMDEVALLRRKSFVRGFANLGYGLASIRPNTFPFDDGLNEKSLTVGYLPIGVGARIKISEAIAATLGYDIYLFNTQNLLGLKNSLTAAVPRQNKASFGYLSIEYTFGRAKSMIWTNPVALLYDELRENDSILHKTEGDRITSVERDMADLKKDTDGDGVVDLFDKCPGTPKGNKVDGSGCDLRKLDTAARVEKRHNEGVNLQIIRDAARSLSFQSDIAVIDPSSFSALDRVADLLNQMTALNLSLEGYTGSSGNDVSNIRLSSEMARAVKDYLVSKGVSALRIETRGLGSRNSIAPNKIAKDRAKNRGVQFNVF